MRTASAETAVRRSLTRDEMSEAVRGMADGTMSPNESAAILTALARRGETVEEVIGAATTLRQLARPAPGVPSELLDTCGTGGDRSGTFNVSTAAAVVVSACGVPVAKHGNRSFSSPTGSADVLEELGVNLWASPDRVLGGLRAHGLAFFFGPLWHPAVGAIAPVRRVLRHRTVFNLIGPLCNPASVAYQVIGTGAPATASLLARALAALGTSRALVVSGEDGLDEVTLAAATRVWEVRGETVREFHWEPEEFGLPRQPGDGWKVSSAVESAAVLRSVFDGTTGPARDLVLANASAALLVSGRAGDLRDGVRQARSALDTGAARERLAVWANWTRGGDS